VDAELEAARNSLDSAKRMALYRQVLETLHTDIAAVPLYQDVMMFAARKEVKFQPTPNEAFFLMDMGWSP
jgi:peptide/nickel transport system substrate-binding protein